MPRPYSEYLRSKHPGIEKIADFYSGLGLEDPYAWALAEIEGNPAVASALFVNQLRSFIAPSGDRNWIQRIECNEINVEDAQIVQQSADAVKALRQLGVDLDLVTPIIRAVQAEVVRNVAGLLDEGPELLCLPMPEGREAHWQLVACRPDGSNVQPISGLHENLEL